jgi:hypothetical protein
MRWSLITIGSIQAHNIKSNTQNPTTSKLTTNTTTSNPTTVIPPHPSPQQQRHYTHNIQAKTSKPKSTLNWHLAPAGHTTCDYGSPATRNDCEAAVTALASVAGKISGQNIQLGSDGMCMCLGGS